MMQMLHWTEYQMQRVYSVYPKRTERTEGNRVQSKPQKHNLNAKEERILFLFLLGTH